MISRYGALVQADEGVGGGGVSLVGFEKALGFAPWRSVLDRYVNKDVKGFFPLSEIIAQF